MEELVKMENSNGRFWSFSCGFGYMSKKWE